MKLDKDLVKYIEKNIIPNYINFDKAHNIEHVKSVIDESLKLAESVGADPMIAYTAAAYHDLGLCKGRELHHIVSGEILSNDKALKKWFSDDEILLMKEAVEDHRASDKNSPRNIYGKIIADADRVIEPLKTTRRIIQYSLKHNPAFSKEEHFENVYNHLKNKFAEGGYLKLNFTDSENFKRLKNLRTIIKNREKLIKIFKELYEEETALI